MTAITRRTFDEIRDEVLKRLGRSDTVASGRVEYWITASYMRIATSFHHYELDEQVAAQAVANGSTSTALPADAYIVMAVRLLDNNSVFIQRLVKERHSHLRGRASSTAAQPKRYSRLGANLYFEAPTDVDYKVDIDYYKLPAAPDFAAAAASPETDWLWDEAIIEMATMMGLSSYWASEHGEAHAAALRSFLESVPQPAVKSGALVDVEGVATSERPHGGAQG